MREAPVPLPDMRLRTSQIISLKLEDLRDALRSSAPKEGQAMDGARPARRSRSNVAAEQTKTRGLGGKAYALSGLLPKQTHWTMYLVLRCNALIVLDLQAD